VKTINLLCAGNKAFVNFQAQGGVLTLTPPLRMPLTVHLRPTLTFLLLLFQQTKDLHRIFEDYE